MNQKNINKQNDQAKLTAEDIQLYRLFCILGVAILGFFALHTITPATFHKILYYGQWVTLALLVLVIGAFCYIRFVKKIDESGNVITSTGIAYFLIPTLFLLTTYRYMQDATFKCQVAFGFVAIFAAIYNIFKKEVRVMTAMTLLSVTTLYYASHSYSRGYEHVLVILSKGLMFIIPALVLAALLFGKDSKCIKALISDRLGSLLTIVMCSVLLVAALLVLIMPSIFLYVMISVLVIYAVIGIVCTIRLI